MNAVILDFHGIGSPHADVDADERRYWVSERRFEEILALVSAHPRSDQIVLTFDDGNASDLAIAAPLLARAGRVGHFFVLTGRLDRPLYLSREDVLALQAFGMHVGLHGRDHVVWAGLDEESLEQETSAARDQLAACLNRPVESVSIPFGRYNARVIRRLKACGFKTIYTSDGGPARSDALVQNRTSVMSDMSNEQILRILDRREPALHKARRSVAGVLKRNFL